MTAFVSGAARIAATAASAATKTARIAYAIRELRDGAGDVGVTFSVVGMKRLEAKLSRLEKRVANRITSRASSKALQLAVTAMRQRAPQGPTGNLKRSHGKRKLKKREANGIVAYKAGPNVAKKPKNARRERRANFAPHAHLVVLGTAGRWSKTKRGAIVWRGKMRANGYVVAAFNSVRQQMARKQADEIKAGIIKEAGR